MKIKEKTLPLHTETALSSGKKKKKINLGNSNKTATVRKSSCIKLKVAYKTEAL